MPNFLVKPDGIIGCRIRICIKYVILKEVLGRIKGEMVLSKNSLKCRTL